MHMHTCMHTFVSYNPVLRVPYARARTHTHTHARMPAYSDRHLRFINDLFAPFFFYAQNKPKQTMTTSCTKSPILFIACNHCIPDALCSLVCLSVTYIRSDDSEAVEGMYTCNRAPLQAEKECGTHRKDRGHAARARITALVMQSSELLH
jgi:hypothetical protein